MNSVSMEDTIEALLDYFVSPLLSIRESSGKPPSDHQQGLIAKQLNAVVVLYNYYHRRQFADLEFSDFKTFIKICCISKPSLLQYLRYMHTCEEVPENANIQYSLTEKMVIDSCDLCLELDLFRKYQVMDAWPISKVAVFLVDSKKEKCVLLRNDATQGVWSIVEKELAGPDYEFLPIESCKSEKTLEKLAFSAVETHTGISCKNLLILEHHLTYSLKYKKTSTWLYIMRYEGKLSNDITEVLIEDVKTSMEGPIVRKDSTCEVTRVVKYYSILPYRETISSWFSREKNGRQADECRHISLEFTEDHNTKIQYVEPSQHGAIIKADESPVDIKAAIEVVGSAELNADEVSELNKPTSSNNQTSSIKELPCAAYGLDLSYDAPVQTQNNHMQASLGILRKSLNELQQRKQLLEDEIALCEMNIKTILKEKENCETSVSETVVGGGSVCSKQVQNNLDSSSEEGNTSPSIKRRKIPEAVLGSRNYCQELDDICHRNNWMLPKYRVMPCNGDHDITGAFKATVELHGEDLDFRGNGDKKSSPSEARQSAASRMISRLRT